MKSIHISIFKVFKLFFDKLEKYHESKEGADMRKVNSYLRTGRSICFHADRFDLSLDLTHGNLSQAECFNLQIMMQIKNADSSIKVDIELLKHISLALLEIMLRDWLVTVVLPKRIVTAKVKF